MPNLIIVVIVMVERETGKKRMLRSYNLSVAQSAAFES
jgi:hypothetical protein